MDAIHVTIDTRLFIVFLEGCGQQAAGGGEDLCYAVVPRRTRPEGEQGRILAFPGGTPGDWEHQEEPEQEEETGSQAKTAGRLFQVLALLATVAVLASAVVITLLFLRS